MAYRGGARSGKTHGKITLPIRVNMTIIVGTRNNIWFEKKYQYINMAKDSYFIFCVKNSISIY